jgi:beta-lactamase regulating signal transducer with metallopeptidase domain
MAVVTGVLLIASPILGRRYKAKTLYIAWLVALIGFLFPLRIIPTQPVFVAKMPAAMAHPVFVVQNEEESAPDLNAAFKDDAGAAIQATGGEDALVPGKAADVQPGVTVPAEPLKPLTWASLAALIWLLGAAVSLLLMITRHMLFLRTVRRWQRPVNDSNVLKILETEKQSLRIKQSVQLMLCPSVNSPMMIGLIRPRMLLPDGDLTTDELPLVIRHELTHLKRRDLWIKVIQLLAVSLHWFNPAVYALSRTLGFWQESSCDEKVTASETQEGKQFYSETIIRVIRRQTRMKSQMTTSFYGGKNGMKRRILAILESGKKRAGIAVCLVTLAAVSSLGLAFAVGLAPEPVKEEAGLQTAYVTRSDADGAPMLFAPTAGDLPIPIASYFNGVPVTIVEKAASSAPEEWGYKDGETNWANVLVGGDGAASGKAAHGQACYRFAYRPRERIHP